MAKRYFLGEYVGLDGVTYDGYYTVEDDVVISFTTEDGEVIDPIGATLDDVLTFTETVKVERVEVREDFPNRDEAYAILRGADGRYAFAWGSKYPYAEELPAEDVKDGESGFKWYDSEDAARAAMNDAISAWEPIRGN